MLWRAVPVVAVMCGAGHYLRQPPSFRGAAGVDRELCRARPGIVADSAPELTMAIVKELSTARRSIDSIAKTHSLASSQIDERDLPRSIDGKIALLTADLNSRPALISAVTRSGLPSTRAYARALTWINTAWSVVIAERAPRATGAGASVDDTAVPGMFSALLAFVREHEAELLALGFRAPQPFVANTESLHDYFASASYRHFFDSSAHTIRLVTTSVSDYLQGFIDSADATAPGTKGRPPLRVLFVGNSLTYYHAMPRLFAHLAAAGLHRRVVAGLVSLPGSTLPQLWDGTDLGDVLRKLPWDVVVMQVHPAGLSDATAIRYARMVSTPIVARHGRVFAWGQYGGPGEDLSFQATLDGTTTDAAHAAHATVAPIPAAWDAVRRADTVVWKRLFDDLPHGDTHPSALGSYLLALSFYRAITGQSPVGLPYTAGDFVVSKADAEQLQRIAASVQHDQIPTYPVPSYP